MLALKNRSHRVGSCQYKVIPEDSSTELTPQSRKSAFLEVPLYRNLLITSLIKLTPKSGALQVSPEFFC